LVSGFCAPAVTACARKNAHLRDHHAARAHDPCGPFRHHFKHLVRVLLFVFSTLANPPADHKTYSFADALLYALFFDVLVFFP
jgi:hypothetical protein